MNVGVPADAWYVWVGVVLVSLSVAGVVLGLPGEPPPDAADAANTIDRVAASEYGTTATAKVDADQARIGTKQLSLRNDGGTAHTSITFGSMTPVDAATGATAEAGAELLAGEGVTTVLNGQPEFDSERELRNRFRELRASVDRLGSNWQETSGRLRVRSVQIGGALVVLVGA
jgi:hypothetical protein